MYRAYFKRLRSRGFLPKSALRLEGGAKYMIKWNYRTTRIALVLGAIAAFAVSSGAQTKWG